MYYLEYIIGIVLCGFYNLQYRYRFGHHKSSRLDESTLYIHIPKTGGTAVAKAIGINGPGHFTVKEREAAAGKADKIIVTIRDPIDRLVSLWNYSKKTLLTKVNSPLKVLGYYDTLDQFINSGIFAAFNKYHYFFRMQKSYMNGYDANRHELVVLNQRTLAEDMKSKLNHEIKVVNKSPVLQTSLSEESIHFLKDLYASDYEFLSEIYKA